MRKSSDYLSLSSVGLKRKLKISFCLMSILPLLVCMYLVSTYILPNFGFKIDITLSIGISTFIAIIGFFVIKEIIDRILSVSTEAKMIAAGDITRTLDIEHPDEVGDLGNALNSLTQRIRSNMEELKGYSEKTTEINLEIQKRVIVLSSLMQISSLISQGAKLEDIMSITVEKSRFIAASDVVYLFFREEGRDDFACKAVNGVNSEYLSKIAIAQDDSFFKEVITLNKPLILDKNNNLSEELWASFYERFRLKNSLVLPVYLRGKVIALLGIGNARESFLYKKDDLELLDIFAKQIAIAVENDLLLHRVQKLEIRDALTGLFNETFIRSRLQEEIKRAITYQRPCAFIMFDIDNFKRIQGKFGTLQGEAILKKIAPLIKDSIGEVDRAARTGDDEFSVLLPERNKRQAQEIAEDIRKKIEFAFSEEHDANKRITVSAGVSENPLDGIDAESLITAAKELLGVAKKMGRNRVAGFKENPICR